MTDRRSYAAAFVLAPVAAGVLSVSTGWALGHDPRGAGSAAVPSAAPSATTAQASSLAEMQARVLAATRRYETARVRLLDAERRIQANVRRLEGMKKASAPSFDAPPGEPAPAVPAPAAPPVSTTTGAS